MVDVVVTGRDGSAQRLQATSGCALMDSLRDADTGIEGTCGGAMSCGTCHVYMDPAWADRLPPKGEDEAAMLEAISDFVELRPTSRLSCQIPMDEALDGLQLEIAPPV